MLLSVLPLTLGHKGTCSHLAAGCRQYLKRENGRNADRDCYSWQQALNWLDSRALSLTVHIEDHHSSFAHTF